MDLERSWIVCSWEGGISIEKSRFRYDGPDPRSPLKRDGLFLISLSVEINITYGFDPDDAVVCKDADLDWAVFKEFEYFFKSKSD